MSTYVIIQFVVASLQLCSLRYSTCEALAGISKISIQVSTNIALHSPGILLWRKFDRIRQEEGPGRELTRAGQRGAIPLVLAAWRKPPVSRMRACAR